MGVCQQHRGEGSKAISLYQASFSTGGQKDVRPLLALGETLVAAGRAEEAQLAFLNGLKLRPLDPEVWLLGANLAAEAAALAQVIPAFSAVLQSVGTEAGRPAGLTALFATLWLNSQVRRCLSLRSCDSAVFHCFSLLFTEALLPFDHAAWRGRPAGLQGGGRSTRGRCRAVAQPQLASALGARSCP